MQIELLRNSSKLIGENFSKKVYISFKKSIFKANDISTKFDNTIFKYFQQFAKSPS